jgi:hypothetical protein
LFSGEDRYVVIELSEDLGNKLLLLFALAPIGKEFNMHLAMVVGLGNPGDSNEPLTGYRQMAVRILSYGKPACTGKFFLQS